VLIDTHAHLFFEDFKDDLEHVLTRAAAVGVEKIIVPGTSIETSKQAIELAKKYSGVLYAAAGVHPEEILNRKSSDHSPIIPQGSEPWEHAIAVGEIGIDLYTEEMKAKLPEQKELFRAQCMTAITMDLPVIIHTRNSFTEVWEVLSSLPQMPRGQFHCFSVDEEALAKVLAAGFYVSFAGNITWSKRVSSMVPLVPLDRLLLETDSPLMVPRDQDGEPVGGRMRNEPASVAYLAQKIAEIGGVAREKIGQITTENAKTLFKL
jgi:TatD DNase family protein